MKVLLEDDVQAIAARVLPWAGRDPVVNNVLATTVEAVRDGRRPYGDTLWIAVIGDGGEVVGAAHLMPPYPLFVCRMPDQVVDAITEALARERADLPGVNGVADTAGAFADMWRLRTGADVVPAMAQRIYQLGTLVSPVGVPGGSRVATLTDRDLLVEWMRAFANEAVHGLALDHVADEVARRIALGGVGVWEVGGRPVAFADANPPSAGVARVGPVYTPPEHRRRGYGAACTAAVTRRALDRGAELCMLYTDLANPTSNSIYQQIGYRPVGDAQEYAFSY